MGIISQTLDMFARSKAMEKTFLMDRQRTIGASEIGSCARKLGWTKNDKLIRTAQRDPDHSDNWGARVRGTIMEDKFWVPALKKRFRKKLMLAGDRQTTIHDRYLSVTSDGLLTDLPSDFLAEYGVPDIGPSRCVYVECKTIDPRVNLTQEKQEHTLQVQVGLGLYRDLTRYKPEYALISYIDASFWDDVDEFVIKFDADTYRTMHERAVKIKTADTPAELKPEGWIAGGKECEWCPFTRACGITRRSVPERELAADPQFLAEITDMCKEHELVNDEIKELTKRLNDMKDQIKNRLREKSVRRLPGVVTWSPIKGSKSTKVNELKEAARAAGVDVSLYENEGEPSDRLQVTLKGAPITEVNQPR